MFKLLIVDDNPSDRNGVQRMIDWTSLHIEVVGIAANGREGCRKAEELEPDIVLTDVSMPFMDGLEMAANMKESLPKVKFVFMSCFDEFEYVKNALYLDAYGYVLKPIRLPELIEVMRKVVEEKQREVEGTEEHRRLLQQINDSMPVLREQFFIDLLYGSATSYDISDRMSYLGLESLEGPFTICYMQIDHYEQMFGGQPVEQTYLVSQKMKNILHSTLLSACTGYIIHQQPGGIACILFPGDEDYELILEKLLDEAGGCRDEMAAEIGSTVTVGIGDLSCDLADIPHIFERARYAVRLKLYSEGGRMILASDVGAVDMPMPYRLEEVKELLLKALNRGQQQQLRTMMDRIFRPESQFTEDYMKSAALTVYYAVSTVCMERNVMSEEVVGPLDAVWVRLREMESVAEIRQWLEQLLHSAVERLGAKEGGRIAAIAEQIKLIIQEHYADYANMEQIVRPLHISANHANMLFKQHTGMTIFEYLIRVKMEAAKSMLLDPYVKVYEIAEKVGYKSKARFGSIFKDYTGLTPKQYMTKYAQPKEL